MQYICAILRLHTCYAIFRLPAQSRDSENVQHSLEIAQIVRLYGTYTFCNSQWLLLYCVAILPATSWAVEWRCHCSQRKTAPLTSTSRHLWDDQAGKGIFICGTTRQVRAYSCVSMCIYQYVIVSCRNRLFHHINHHVWSIVVKCGVHTCFMDVHCV